MSEKIKPGQLARKAILYVRQSSTYQVLNNLESQKLQYAMQARVRELGFAEIDIIDEDLGRSAAGGITRTGFERMVAQVCLGEVGAVCAREVSRFARNSRDWQQLVEVCRVVDTVLIDHEMVYDPRQSNDRLLLGLKGTLNEYELDLLRQRASEARLQKAKRGELGSNCPIGFVRGDQQVFEKDPDLRIQNAIALVFKKFLELGSARQALFWILENNLTLPARTNQGGVQWGPPTYWRVYRLLTNPTYGGAYAYGKTESVTRYHEGASRQRSQRRDQGRWTALIPEAHEGYISWSQFQQIQRMISSNRLLGSEPTTSVRQGLGLLAGLLRCRRCARMLHVYYKGSDGKDVRYACTRAFVDNREPRCVAFSGKTIHEPIVGELLRVLQPAAIEAAVIASQQQAEVQADLVQALRRDWQAARYKVQRAERQYEAVDPENRLVAEELERRWNEALTEMRALEQRLNQEEHVQTPNVGTIDEFDTLASDVESLWNHPQADTRTKKRLIKALIQEIVVDIDEQTNELVVLIHWKGGVHTPLRMHRRHRGDGPTHTSKDIVKAVELLARIYNDKMIAGVLNRAKLRTGRGNFWTRTLVTSLRSNHNIECHDTHRQLAEGWMNLSQASKLTGISTRTLRLAIESGELTAERPIECGPWILNKEILDRADGKRFLERVRLSKSNTTVPSSSQAIFDLSTT
jgi:DNA invertase Pin-like site-specific DNA recombinase